MINFLTRLKHNQQGFHLIEMMVTIALIGIVAVLGIPRFMSSNNFFNAKSGAKVTAAAICSAQTRALSGQSWKVVFDTSANPGKIYLAPNSIDDAMLPTLPEGVNMIELKGARLSGITTKIIFKGNGNPASPGGIVVYATYDSSMDYSVDVSALGQVSVSEI